MKVSWYREATLQVSSEIKTTDERTPEPDHPALLLFAVFILNWANFLLKTGMI